MIPAILASLQTDLSILLRLLVALVLGAIVGWEREAAGKAAGLRTHMLVALAAALFVALGDAVLEHFAAQAEAGTVRSDPVRVIEAVVTGISFLGAGTIFVSRGQQRVEGLTTAAAIWATAAIGIAVGLERFGLAAGSTLLVFIVLRLVPLAPRGHTQHNERTHKAP
jgi:putative Mg2+ transporter-C (MgtC) family protein